MYMRCVILRLCMRIVVRIRYGNNISQSKQTTTLHVFYEELYLNSRLEMKRKI